MKNTIKTFTLFVRDGSKSEKVANSIRYFNKLAKKPLSETDDGDLIIAIGGDGTFLDAVTSTNFSKNKVYVGVHTGTLGFLPNLSPSECFALIQYLNFEDEIRTKKIWISSIDINLTTSKTLHYHALNEVIIGGSHYSNISFSESIDGKLLQNVVATGILISTNTGDTAHSMNAGGAIIFGNYPLLTSKLLMASNNVTCERNTGNPIVSSNVLITITEPSSNIEIVIDGVFQEKIISNTIKSIHISMKKDSDYIHNFILKEDQKVDIFREKILGYKI